MDALLRSPVARRELLVRYLQLDRPVSRVMLHLRTAAVNRNEKSDVGILRHTKTFKRHLQFQNASGGHFDIRTSSRGITAAAGTVNHLDANGASARADDDAAPFRFEEIDTQLLVDRQGIPHRYRPSDLQVQVLLV